MRIEQFLWLSMRKVIVHFADYRVIPNSFAGVLILYGYNMGYCEDVAPSGLQHCFLFAVITRVTEHAELVAG
jgi:hypothetical protein